MTTKGAYVACECGHPEVAHSTTYGCACGCTPHPHSCRCDACWSEAMTEQESQR